MLNNFSHDNFEYDECTAKGSCSIPPSISALQEVLLISLSQLAYYVLRLKEFQRETKKYEIIIIESLASIISTTDYSNEQMLNMVSNIYFNVVKTRNEYKNLAKEQGSQFKELKSVLNLSPQMNLSQVMALGERAFLAKYKRISSTQKNIMDILLAVLKSVALNLSKVLNYGIYPQESIDIVLDSLDLLNRVRILTDKYKEQIRVLAQVDTELLALLYEKQIELFGELQQSEVSLSTESGKAILVSGNDLLDLKNLLEAIGEKSIDIYTHDDLLIAHSYSNFLGYKNFKGHYGTCNDNCVLDFATFPGAILLTKNSSVNIEYLYRGRLYTTSNLLPQGVIAVKDNDFSGVISSAEKARGFNKGHKRSVETVGFSVDDINRKFENLKERLDSGEIKHLFVFGLSATRQTQQDYLSKFMAYVPEDVFVLSFSFNFNHPNFMLVNIANNRPVLYGILKILFAHIPIDSSKITFFLTKCDVTSLSNMINLKEKGVKNIYLAQCPPNIVNPTVLSSLDSIYDIKSTSNPKSDLEEILG